MHYFAKKASLDDIYTGDRKSAIHKCKISYGLCQYIFSPLYATAWENCRVLKPQEGHFGLSTKF